MSNEANYSGFIEVPLIAALDTLAAGGARNAHVETPTLRLLRSGDIQSVVARYINQRFRVFLLVIRTRCAVLARLHTHVVIIIRLR